MYNPEEYRIITQQLKDDVRAFCKRTKKTQKELAEAIGYSQYSFSHWLNGDYTLALHRQEHLRQLIAQ